MSASEAELIYLYTSNIREKYVTDALAVVAQADGTIVRFRYERKYVSDVLAAAWGESLVGRECLVHLSIQHTGRFHDSAFVPLRRARVSQAFTEGAALVVDLELSSYAALPDPAARQDRGSMVRIYSSLVRDSGISNPDGTGPTGTPRISAGLGVPYAQLNASLRSTDGFSLEDRADTAFSALVGYLSATLTNPERFYYRVVSIKRVGKRRRTVVVPTVGEYRLLTGRSYILRIAHYQTETSLIPSEISVAAGDGIDTRDVSRLDIRSRYDIFDVPVDVAAQPAMTRSFLLLRPTVEDRGPSVRLDLVLQPSRSQRYPIPAAGAIGTALIALAASGAIADKFVVGVIASIAATGMFLLGLWQTKRGLKLF